ncbi:MAG: excinuclease ABC subunit UvrA, partial [Deltaproteobacteria bacterium]|nr:excinuclease ABC subunit UvrA [Deltaproteobacteria bacterium]
KSSLAFDTLYAEGQRRYVESLSAYARQFLEQMEKPDVDSIDGLSPSIAIEQKSASKNPRSTVGTITEIYDYLRLLYARAGQVFCTSCGKPISRQTVQEMADQVMSLPPGTRLQILAPVIRGRKGKHKQELREFQKQGFVRVRVDGQLFEIGENFDLDEKCEHEIDLVVDRIVVKEDVRGRITESLETSLRLAQGLVVVDIGPGESESLLSENNACIDCGVSFPEITPRTFSFNSPHGACPQCSGIGTCAEFNPERVVPDTSLSMADGAIAPWSGKRNSKYYKSLLASLAEHFGVSLDTPWKKLSAEVQQGILCGMDDEISFSFQRAGKEERTTRKWDGVLGELERRRRESDSDGSFEELAQYTSPHGCPSCEGSRLRIEARHIKLNDVGIHELTALSIGDASHFLEQLDLPAREAKIAERIMKEVRARLRFLLDVGLHYLSLNRASASLSGGEGQRIRLATQVGSNLMGVVYILDEPSIGLHARDNARLVETLKRLRDLGNSVIVVEHDDHMIRQADTIFDMGPGAGVHGGLITAQGSLQEIKANPNSLTGDYLSGRRSIPVPKKRRKAKQHLVLEGCREHNLKGVTLRVPLGVFSAVTGVSGSGKSSLINDTLYRVLARDINGSKENPGEHTRVQGVERLDKVIEINQGPIGRTPRSNPATYTGIFDSIRQAFAQVPEARVRGYGAGRFSFNIKGGRCEACRGDGVLRIEMHFLPDLFVTCEVCDGKRYNRETLEIRYKGRNIAEVLEMSVEEALVFFANVPKVRRPLQTLHDVGLDYLQLGQAASTLSGGEAQRIKLARELSKRGTGRTVFILDEPTTGLHFADVEKLLEVLQRLVDQGNTVIVIEHHLDVIKCADHLIDLGPEGGDGGGEIVVTGTP